MLGKLWLYYRLLIVYCVLAPFIWVGTSLTLVLTLGQLRVNANVRTGDNL